MTETFRGKVSVRPTVCTDLPKGGHALLAGNDGDGARNAEGLVVAGAIGTVAGHLQAGLHHINRVAIIGRNGGSNVSVIFWLQVMFNMHAHEADSDDGRTASSGDRFDEVHSAAIGNSTS